MRPGSVGVDTGRSSDEDDVGAIKHRFGVKKRVAGSASSSSSLRAKLMAKDDGTEKAFRKRLL